MRRFSRRLGLCTLEARLTPAFAALDNGVLTLSYTAAGTTPENVTLANDGVNLTLVGDVAGPTTFPTAGVTRIVVQDTGGGSAQSWQLTGAGLNLDGLAASGIEFIEVDA